MRRPDLHARREAWRAAGRCIRCGGIDPAWLTGPRRYQDCGACRLRCAEAMRAWYATLSPEDRRARYQRLRAKREAGRPVA